MAIAKLETPSNFRSLRKTTSSLERPNSNAQKILPLKRYFLAFEGKETEKQYFNGIYNNRDTIGVLQNIELIPLNRTQQCQNFSNPKGIMEGCLLKFGLEKSKGYDESEIIDYDKEQDYICPPFCVKKHKNCFAC